MHHKHNRFFAASGRVLSSWQVGCVSTLRKQAARLASAPIGNVCISPLIWQIGSRSPLYNCGRWKSLRKSLTRLYPYEKRSGVLLKMSYVMKLRRRRISMFSIVLQPSQTCLRNWSQLAYDQFGVLRLRLQLPSPSLPVMQSICFLENFGLGFTNVRIQNVA